MYIHGTNNIFYQAQVAIELLVKLQRWGQRHALLAARRLSSSSYSSSSYSSSSDPTPAPAPAVDHATASVVGNKQPASAEEEGAGERQPLLGGYVLVLI